MNDLRQNTAWRPKKRKTRVTIIVGIIGKQEGENDAIIFASDSQTTWPTRPLKRMDTDKIAKVRFSDRDVLVAQSGDSTMGARTIEIMAQDAQLVNCDDYRKPADLAQEAMAKAKKEAIRLNNLESHFDAAQEFLRENSFSLMIAYYLGDKPPKPFIYVLDSSIGIANQEKDYCAVGCGATVAELMLSRSDIPTLSSYETLITAIYTVEEVKRVDPFCGGPTKIGMIFSTGACVLTDTSDWKDYVRITVDVMSQRDKELRDSWKKMMTSITKEVIERFQATHKRPSQ